MSPSPAPDPPPPPIGLDQETPLQAIIQQTRYLLQYLKEAASSKNPTQSLNFDQIFHVLSNVSDVHSNLEKLNSLEKNKETVINPSSDLKSEPQILDKILERLDRIERRSAIPAPPPPATWAAVAHGSKKKPNPPKEQPHSVPTNAEINEFKKASVIIHTPPGFTAMDSMSAPEITSKINNVFTSINATVKSQTIEASGIALLPSKDLKIYVNTREQARWLLTNKHTWTELVDSKLKTFPSRFPVILHAIPTNFDPANQAHLHELGKQNRIDPSLIQSARWLGDPVRNGKKNGSLVLQLLSKEIALKVEKTGLFLQNELYRGVHYIRSIPQCFRCWKLGHTAQWCKNSPLCNKCTGNHDSKTCNTPQTESTKCCKCITRDKLTSKNSVNTLDEKYAHPPWSQSCPSMKQDIQCRKQRRWNV
ncbi:hypothetical protein PTTG_01710 [Puccinia triticina 1-1 BBBD Race 1]|uniref:CCHC-type domain-containing protein n=1 Tax=Puccinia triticina (isolate 1-1 / race 1 (BBBD)) TaxID=630390 RepID=A0A0C4ELS3_PUCT1|nr:hypothetical protein PTTG_01710 [Puccinia triticina 1-1 BBBD Race 1]